MTYEEIEAEKQKLYWQEKGQEPPPPLGITIPGKSDPEKVPAPGGGFWEGPGGQAPSFAPGGKDNPYPDTAGMAPPSISYTTLIPDPQSSVGDQGAGSLPQTPGLEKY